MARNVHEIMNHELFALRVTDSVDLARAGILAFGITGAPVLDERRRPVGMVSLRDLVDAEPGPVGARMRSPVPMVRPEATIAEAGRVLAESGHHRVVVVDREGRAVGNVSALDVVRGLLGMPIVHPPAFPHLDRETGLVWTDEAELDLEQVGHAPAGPGLFTLVHGGPAFPDAVVWAEAAENVRARLVEMLARPEDEPPALARLLEGGRLKFRAASCGNPSERLNALAKVRATAMPEVDELLVRDELYD